MDEIAVPRLNQWLGGCRLLMHAFPQLGIDLIDIASGMGELRWRGAGWHKSGSDFVFVPESPEYGPAFTTSEPPPPGTPVHEVPPGPSVLSSYFWHTVMPGFARESQPGAAGVGWSVEKMAVVTRSIEHAHRTYGSGGPTPALKSLGRQCVDGMARAYDGARLGVMAPEGMFTSTLGLVRSYMAFEIPGKVAAEVLALLLSVQALLPQLGPISTLPPSERVTIVDHLVAVFNRVLAARDKVQVTPYYELAYLANLYAVTAVLLVSHARESAGQAKDLLTRIEGLGFTVEERRAHRLRFDTALIAIDRMPAHLAEKADRDGISLRTACRELAVHPALAEVVLGQAAGTLPAGRTVPEFQTAAGSYDRFDVLGAVEGSFSPIPPEVHERVLLAISPG
jgi:hypothetical protein